ncbi:terpene synthase family protein [Longispora albida]|uniref:terpene synthase family protein n=1 Tax=Longispora albida TaxID=203523 RepID=UPI00037CFB1B|nr:hypothetical protein [Longispora albida]
MTGTVPPGAWQLPVRDRWLPALAARMPGLLLPTRIHPQAPAIREALASWAARTGLACGERETARLLAAGYDRMAARALSEEPVERAVLFARWLAWLFAFDDELDTGASSQDAGAVRARYAMVMAAASDPRGPFGTPLETAFADLWQVTSARTSVSWRDRFLSHMDDQREAWISETTARAEARPPGLSAYGEHRRRSAGQFIFDLPEAVLGLEVPAAVLATEEWRTLTDAANDVTAWCNDIASLPKELAAGEVHNYVLVIAQDLGCGIPEAVEHVTAHIIRRCEQLPAVVAGVVRLCGDLGMPGGEIRRISRVATALQALPGTHMEWLLESGRYHSGSPVPA